RIGFDYAVEAGFVERNFIALQGRDLGGVLVDAGDMVTEICKTRARDEADVSRPDYGYPHSHLMIIQSAGGAAATVLVEQNLVKRNRIRSQAFDFRHSSSGLQKSHSEQAPR